ncbi:hypothetical protein BRD17_05340 [Halobacteriales archaeon SW_7_68_16]|nr:MAG: hypothetical protein BRD17_05340 [Halobacteriales archaeon SW_7_68_16]
MLDDGDRILDLVGIALVLALVAALGVVALNFNPPESETVPEANWTIERLNDSHVRVTHAGGDPVRTENLYVTVDSIERRTGYQDPVTPGVNATVPASTGSMVRVVWNGGRGERQIMARKRV